MVMIFGFYCSKDYIYHDYDEVDEHFHAKAENCHKLY